MMNLRSNVKRIAVASVAAAGLSLAATPSAWANNATGTNPTSGGPVVPLSTNTAGQFQFLTTNAACPLASNQPNGDLLDSFVVDNNSVPTGQIHNITFANGLPVLGSYTGTTLVDTNGSPLTNAQTNPAVAGSTVGTWGTVTEGPFTWQPFADGPDYGSGFDLHDGTFNVGIACVTPSNTIDNGQFWSLQVTFTSTGNAPPFNWGSQPGPTTPEVPLALILPISGAGILLAGVFLVRRRQRHAAAAA
jgi:hypothetical protein